MRLKFFIPLFAFLVVLNSGCKKEDLPPDSNTSILAIELVSPAKRVGVVDVVKKKVAFTAFELGTDLTKVVYNVTLPNGASINPAAGTEIDFSKGPVSVTVTNGDAAAVYTVSVVVELPPRIGFLGGDETALDIEEADTKVAYAFLKSKFKDNIRYLALKNVDDDILSTYDLLYFYSDTEKDSVYTAESVLPKLAYDEKIAKALRDWHRKGGNFILAGHATQFLKQLDRIPQAKSNFEKSPFAPSVFSAGGGDFENLFYGLNPNFNVTDYYLGYKFDKSFHPIFEGMGKDSIIAGTKNSLSKDSVIYQKFPHFRFDVHGYKEGHYSMWSLVELQKAPEISSLDRGVAAVDFQSITKSKILSTIQNDSIWEFASIIEFESRDGVEGKILAIGSPGYEWTQTNLRNLPSPNWLTNTDNYTRYNNVRKITENMINYLLK